MAGSDDEEDSEPPGDEPEEAAQHLPPPWWRPAPAAEAAPDPSLPAAAEDLRRADILLLLVGEEPPSRGYGALRTCTERGLVGYSLLVPTAGQWLEQGWPAHTVLESDPVAAATLRPDQVEELQDCLLKMLEGVLTSAIRSFPSGVETNVVCLDIAGHEAAPRMRQGIHALLPKCPGSVLVSLGLPEGEEPTVEQHRRVSDVGLEEALEWLEREFARFEMATFVVVDAPFASEALNGGAEVVMPRDSPVLRCYRKVVAEYGQEAHYLMHVAPYIMAQNCCLHTTSGQLDPSQPVPWQFFCPTAIDKPLVTKLVIPGVGFPHVTKPLEQRREYCLGILREMIGKFGTEDYQTRLHQVRDQCELRQMVKAVHLTVLPKHGYPLTTDSGFTESIQWQTRMQAFLQSGLIRCEDSRVGDLSLYLSGALKLSSLPPKYKEKTEKSAESARTADATSAGPPMRASSCLFKSYTPPIQQLYGGWFGWRRVPTFFLYSSSDDMADYLRADPDGPFSGRLDDWPLPGQPLSTSTRWHRWGFTEDAKEAILKTDWHALPNSCGEWAELFVPRKGRRDRVCGAPPRFVAFAEAFRSVNHRCWMKLAKALKTMQASHEKVWGAGGGKDLVHELVKSLTSDGLFGIIEAQVWWGKGSVVLPSHKDGATSLLHLSLTLGGSRTLRVGLFRSMLAGSSEPALEADPRLTERLMKDPKDPEEGKKREDVWDDAGWQVLTVMQGLLDDVRMVRGSVYLSSPYCFEHGVRYEAGSQDEPVIALQCRFAFEPSVGTKLNGRRDSVMWDICNTISKTLVAAADSGELRMPSVEEVKQMQQCLSNTRGVMPVGVMPVAVMPVAIEAALRAPQSRQTEVVGDALVGKAALRAPQSRQTEIVGDALMGKAPSPPLQTPAPAQPPAAPPAAAAPAAAPAAAARPAKGESSVGAVAAAPTAAPAVAPAAAPMPLAPLPMAAPPQEWPTEPEPLPLAAPGPPSVLVDRGKEKLLAEKDKAFKVAAKERERLREFKHKALEQLEHAKALKGVAICAEEVEVIIRHGQKDGSVKVTVPGSATMLEVKQALVQKIGRGLVRKVQLVKEKGNTFTPYRDKDQLGDRRELVMLGLAL